MSEDEMPFAQSERIQIDEKCFYRDDGFTYISITNATPL